MTERLVAIVTLSLLAVACGHGPLTSDDGEGGLSADASAEGGDSGAGAAKPCDWAQGACACFIRLAAPGSPSSAGCCVANDTKLASQSQGSETLVFNPNTNSGTLARPDVSCRRVSCVAAETRGGILVDCADPMTTECGCD